jgi:hypothetical protein
MIHILLWLLRIIFLLEVGFNHNQYVDLLKNNREHDFLYNDPELEIPWKTNDQRYDNKLETPTNASKKLRVLEADTESNIGRI